MAENLKRANIGFQKLLKEAKLQKDADRIITKEVELLLYLFYLKGFSEGSGMTQVIV